MHIRSSRALWSSSTSISCPSSIDVEHHHPVPWWCSDVVADADTTVVQSDTQKDRRDDSTEDVIIAVTAKRSSSGLEGCV